MLIHCPACDKKYMIDDTAITDKGRKVRCGACGNVWFHEASDLLTLDPSESGITERPHFREDPLQGLAVEDDIHDTSQKGLFPWIKKYYIDWLVIFVALAIIIGVAWNERGSIFDSPEMAPVPRARDPYYAPLQQSAKDQKANGLSIASVHYVLDNSQSPQHILVTGELVNQTKETLSIPQLRITVHAADKAPQQGLQPTSMNPPASTYSWKHQPETLQILPGERLAFKSIMPSPGWAAIHKLFVAFDIQEEVHQEGQTQQVPQP